MLEEVQLLPPDKERESDVEIVKTHLETMLLLTMRREGRDHQLPSSIVGGTRAEGAVSNTPSKYIRPVSCCPLTSHEHD